MERSDLYRNRFHFCAPQGWLNDPNGLSYYEGRYHLFYQHNPHATRWGPMHWGHAVSADLLHWSHLPIALAPERPYDLDGCFSGTAVQDGDRHILMYTGNRGAGPDGPAGDEEAAGQTQCIAIGDGTRYHKLDGNPVIGSDLLPAGCTPADFRDPKLWTEGGHWYCLVAARDLRAGGELLLYTSADLQHWQYIGIVASGEGRFGTMWECPDFFPMPNGEVLVWSPQNVPRNGCRYQNKHSSVYSIGRLDRATGAFDGSQPQELDLGPDFYAPQSLHAPDGRRIMVAWMQMWERTIPTDELGHGWAGAMTIPRELEIENGTLVQHPVRELETFRTNPRSIDARIDEMQHGEEFGIRGHYLDLELRLSPDGARRCGLVVKQGRNEGTRITYSPEKGRLVLDRSRSGLPIASTAADRPECNISCCEVRPPAGELSLRVILDRSSCEIFADGGRRVMSATIYPAQESDAVSFFAEGGTALVRGTVWDLRLS